MWIALLLLSWIALGVAAALWVKSRPKYKYSLVNLKEKKEREEKPKLARLAIVAGIISVGFGAGFMWTTKPWWHWLWFNLFYMMPTFWIILLISGAIIFALLLKERIKSAVTVGVISFIVLFILAPFFASPYTLCKIYANSTSTNIEALPETTEVRYLPMEVAQYYGENKVQESEIKLGDFDPVLQDGQFIWIAPREQDGIIRRFSYQTDGVTTVNSSGSVEHKKVPMQYGEGMMVTDDILWKLREHKYFVDYCEIYYLFDGGTPVAVAPYLGFRYQFPVMVPYWAGVCFVYPDGTIKDCTPQQAQALSFTQGHRLFPEKLARLYAESWAYKYGIPNRLFTHKDQVEIPNVAYSENEMPYLLPTSEGSKWVVAAEPHGKAFGIFKVFLIDTRSGEIELYEVPSQTSLVGPNRAWEYAKAAFPMYDWYKEAGEEATGNIMLLEPRPVVSNDQLYWMMTITTTDHAFAPDKPSTVLVNAKTTRTISFDSESQVRSFLKTGEAPQEIPTPPEQVSDVQKQLEKIKELQKQLNKAIEKLEEMLS